jgi:hypothetical protein
MGRSGEDNTSRAIAARPRPGILALTPADAVKGRMGNCEVEMIVAIEKAKDPLDTQSQPASGRMGE